ncbi:MAG: SDR family oxidoreductase [Phreatobacter sp.]|jgi:3-oxoacyl-[acyl-carrier protein] reductase|uniref:SDR family oxidoreductase n=1 Tax=Phreatobacter sp. TaxID=1966341 RepID=UPI0040365A78
MGAGAGLSGKLAVVTGASRGIGRAIALRLAADGAEVAVHYNAGAEAAAAVVAAIAGAGGRAFALQADLGAPDGIDALVAGLGSRAVDILVNNAGISPKLTFGEASRADFDLVIGVNLRAPFFIVQGLLPNLRDGGRVINISSMGTRAVYPAMAVYAPAKAGLEALTKILAVELGRRGITVNAVSPGATATDMNERARDPVIAAQIAQTVALGRVGQPEDIADIVGLLASDGGRWITGQVIDASGGQRL